MNAGFQGRPGIRYDFSIEKFRETMVGQAKLKMKEWAEERALKRAVMTHYCVLAGQTVERVDQTESIRPDWIGSQCRRLLTAR